MPDLSDTIETAAGQPKAASGDAGSVTMPSVSELIEADRYLASKEAASATRRGLNLIKLQPPGSV